MTFNGKMSSLNEVIIYEFNLINSDLKDFRFEVKLDSPIKKKFSEGVPKWALLEYKQCRNCDLDSYDCISCAMALSLEQLVAAFGDHLSTERTIVTVTTPQRTFREDCDLQTGINSLLGLLMVNSGCSVLKPLRMLMNFHIPFCSTREMLRRVVGAYLTEQYYVQRSGGTADWELNELKNLYSELSKLNQDFVRRIQGAIKKMRSAMPSLVSLPQLH